jgi:phosphogluconate dehydratase
VDAVAGTLDVLLSEADWAARDAVARPPELGERSAHDLGRELFAGLRRNVRSAEEGAVSWL